MLQTEQDLQAKSGGLHYAFVICLGGFLLSGIVLAAQRLPSIALDSVRQTLGVGYAEVGLITSVFMIFYAGLSLVWGMLGDKIGTRWAMTLALCRPSVRFSSVCSAARALLLQSSRGPSAASAALAF